MGGASASGRDCSSAEDSGAPSAVISVGASDSGLAASTVEALAARLDALSADKLGLALGILWAL